MGVEGPAVAACCGASHGATHMGEVALPLALNAVAEIENASLADVGTENILNRATRMARSWQQLQNGGFTARQQRAFQEAIWRHVLSFVTGPRRIARGLMQMSTADISKDEALRFLAPYSAQGQADSSSSSVDE